MGINKKVASSCYKHSLFLIVLGELNKRARKYLGTMWMHDMRDVIVLTAQHSQPINAFDCAHDFVIPSRNKLKHLIDTSGSSVLNVNENDGNDRSRKTPYTAKIFSYKPKTLTLLTQFICFERLNMSFLFSCDLNFVI